MSPKLTEMRNGFEAAYKLLKPVKKNLKHLIYSTSGFEYIGNKIQGGRIAQFSSAGIKDTASILF